MSILEEIASVGETPSPNTALRPRSRLRTSSRISQRYQERMREEEEKHVDTDESTPPRTRGRRVTRMSTRAEIVESVDDGEEGEEEEDDDAEQEQEATHFASSRYSFRERGAVKKPMRFDQSVYNDVFYPMRDYTETQAARKSRRREEHVHDHKARRRARRSSRGRRLKRRRRDDEDEEDEDEIDEMEYATDESDIGEIQRRIEEQERAEAAEAAAAVAAVQALEDAPRHSRPTRYALRYRDAEASVNDSLSPVRGPKEASSSVSRRRARREEAERQARESEQQNANDEEETKEEDDGEDDEENHETDGRRYYLRHRSNSDPHEHEEPPSRTTRASQRSSTNRDNRRREQRLRDRRQRIEDAAVAKFDTGDVGPRYSLRDRSKVQRVGEGTPPRDRATMSAYAEYAKRQAGRSSQRSSGHLSLPPAPVRRSGRSTRKRRGERRRRLSGSSSSSSSSDDMYKYYDSDKGGMRMGGSGSKRRGSGPVDRKRADITPIEVDRSITWESVGGLEKHIEALKEMVMLPLLYPEFYEKYNVTPPSGVLFYGPPGTGKTLLARALANSCTVEDDSPATKISLDGSEVLDQNKPRHVTFYMRKGADCLSKWVGEAERQLRLLFEEAKRNQPSIIFFDEIDGLAPVRSAKQDQIHASIVSTLLALMDGLDSRGRVVVIGATNRLDAIDPALRRPGRFDRELGFKLPNVQERKKTLEIHTKKWNPPLAEDFIQEIALRTVGYCGADIKALCAEAALCSLRRVYPQVYGSQDKLLIQLDKIVVSRGDFTKAMKKVTPASHRSVSSFASPLPRGVKSLLDVTLNSILKTIAKQFPLFPLDPQAMDAIYKSDGDLPMTTMAASAEDEEENDDDDIYAVMNHDDCDVCHGDEGELLCCDACPGAFHPTCLPSDHCGPDKLSSAWFCADCSESSKAEALIKAKDAKQKQRQARQLFMLPQLVGFPRVLVTGVSGMGQQYVGAALLHSMEGLTHFSLDYPSLVADINTHHAEEALIHRLNEAQKCLPCVLYLPQADLWWENTTESMHVTLKMMLMNMQIKSNLPVLFLATTSNNTRSSLPKSLLELFTSDRTVQRSSILWEMEEVATDVRRRHFGQAFAAFGASPLPRKKRSRADEKLEVLPLAPLPKKTKREPTVEELERIREHDLHCLRELRIFLGQVLDYCAGQRMYSPFHFPVDPEAVPDYYLIIKNPMDLTTMREKMNDGDYTCFEQFLDDIQLIVRNANMFNPKRSATRHIAHAAGTMKDNIMSFAHRFRKHQGYDLFAKCREITKRLHTNPALYSEVPGVSGATAKRNAAAKPPSRTSARLKGIKAPEIEKDDAWSNPKTSKEVVDAPELSVSSEGIQDESAPQWFGGADAKPKTTKPIETDSSSPDVEVIDVTDAQDEMEVDMASSAVEVFEEGDAVFVQPRTRPGMNKLGGPGRITHRNDDGTYHVKYILGGSEKSVEAIYISHFTEDAVKQSVKNQRPEGSGQSVEREEVAVEKSTSELEMDFFSNLVWPILVDEGWTRDEVKSFDGRSGKVTRSVRFFPPTSAGGESPSEDVPAEAVFESAEQVLKYIESNKPLAIKCFGKRYAETPLTEVVFSESVEDNKNDAASDTVDASSSSTHVLDEGANTEVVETATAESTIPTTETAVELEEVEEPSRVFVYDENRMNQVLDDLVEKTASWTVEELRDELLLLNKLAYPFRFEYDRSKLMEDIESHVASLRR